MVKGVKTFTIDVPVNDLFSMVRNLDSRIQPLLMNHKKMEIVGYSPEVVLEENPDSRLVTRGRKGGLITTHNFSQKVDDRTEVMLEMEISVWKGGSTAINLNQVLWIMTYKGIESGYKLGKGADLVRTAPSESLGPDQIMAEVRPSSL